MDNICHYNPIINFSLREVNRRFDTVHRYLCFLAAGGGGGGGTASDGLSVNGGGSTVLGQDVGEAGDPAALTANREVPLAGFDLQFTDTGSEVNISGGSILISGSDAIATPNIVIRDTDSGDELQFSVGGGSANIQSTTSTQFTFSDLLISSPTGIFVAPSAYLTLGAGTAAAGTAPLKLTAGTDLTVPEDGALEFDGTNATITIGGVRNTITNRESALTFSAPLSRVGNTISIPDAAADGATKGAAAFTASDFNATAGVISIDYTNAQAASASVNGFMTTGTQSFAGAKTFNAQLNLGTTGSNGALSLKRTSDGAEVALLSIVSGSPVFNSVTAQWDINSGGSTRMRVGVNGIFVGAATNAAARLEIVAGQAGANAAPLKFNSGTNLTTAVAGCMEYNGTNLFFTRTGTTRESVWVGNGGAAAPTTTPGTTIVNFYGTDDANFLGEPNQWGSVVIGGTTFKIPLYT